MYVSYQQMGSISILNDGIDKQSFRQRITRIHKNQSTASNIRSPMVLIFCYKYTENWHMFGIKMFSNVCFVSCMLKDKCRKYSKRQAIKQPMLTA